MRRRRRLTGGFSSKTGLPQPSPSGPEHTARRTDKGPCLPSACMASGALLTGRPRSACGVVHGVGGSPPALARVAQTSQYQDERHCRHRDAGQNYPLGRATKRKPKTATAIDRVRLANPAVCSCVQRMRAVVHLCGTSAARPSVVNLRKLVSSNESQQSRTRRHEGGVQRSRAFIPNQTSGRSSSTHA